MRRTADWATFTAISQATHEQPNPAGIPNRPSAINYYLKWHGTRVALPQTIKRR
jgi:hypothetical protein